MPYFSSTGPSSPSKTYTFEATSTKELENLRPTNSGEVLENANIPEENSLDQLLETSLRDDAQISDVIKSATQRQDYNHQTSYKDCRFRSIRISQPGRKVYVDLMSGENTTPGEVIFEAVAGYSDHNSPIFETKIKGLKGPCHMHRDTYFQLSAGSGEIIQLKAESAQFRCRSLAPHEIENRVLSLLPKPYEIAMNMCQGGFPGNVRLHVFPLLDFSAKISIGHRGNKPSTPLKKEPEDGHTTISIAIDGTYDDRPIEWSKEVKFIALALQQFSEVQGEIRAIMASIAAKAIDTIKCDGPVIDFQINNLRYEAIEGFPATDIAYNLRIGLEPLFSAQYTSSIEQSLAEMVSGTAAQKMLGGRSIGSSQNIVIYINGTLSGEISASKTIGRSLETIHGTLHSNLYFEIRAPRLGKLNYQVIAVQGSSSDSHSACCSTRLAILTKGYQGAQLSMSVVFEGLKISRIINGNLSKKRVFGGKKTVRNSENRTTGSVAVDEPNEVLSDLNEIVLAEGKTLFERTISLIQ